MRNGNEEDLRVRRTKKLLNESLIMIMQKKPFEKITVKDICDDAMVHRTTFYMHFEDKYDLLRYCMNELESPFNSVDIDELSYEGYKKYYMTVARDILGYVNDNHDFFRMIIKKNKDESFLTHLQDELSLKIGEKLQQYSDFGIDLPLPAPLLSTFYAGACVSVVCWWLTNNMPYTVDELITYLDLLTSPMLNEAVKNMQDKNDSSISR